MMTSEQITQMFNEDSDDDKKKNYNKFVDFSAAYTRVRL